MRDMKSVVAAANGMPRAARWAALGVLVVAAAVAAVPAVRAQGMGGHGMGGPGPMMFGGPPEHVARTVDHLLDGLNATDAQRAQIKQIAMAAAADLKMQAERVKGLRDRGMQAFAAPTVDANAAEAVRQELETQHDQASKRVLQAMLDVAKVLTPEQRASIAERMRQRLAIMQERMSREHHDRPAR